VRGKGGTYGVGDADFGAEGSGRLKGGLDVGWAAGGLDAAGDAREEAGVAADTWCGIIRIGDCDEISTWETYRLGPSCRKLADCYRHIELRLRLWSVGRVFVRRIRFVQEGMLPN